MGHARDPAQKMEQKSQVTTQQRNQSTTQIKQYVKQYDSIIQYLPDMSIIPILPIPGPSSNLSATALRIPSRSDTMHKRTWKDPYSSNLIRR